MRSRIACSLVTQAAAMRFSLFVVAQAAGALQINRRDVCTTIGGATLAAPFAAVADAPAETVRKAASNIPGLGPPDVLFPADPFKGRWRVSREVASETRPLGDDAAKLANLFLATPQKEAYETRYLAYGDGLHVVADRGFETERRAAAGAFGAGYASAKARWEPSNPNVCTLEGAGGSLLELKVTKRSFEEPGPGAFGSSEYSRIAVAGGGTAAVPTILARRVQAKYKWDGSSILGLEILSVYAPTATGFGDLNGASPVLVVKSRLALARPD